MVEQQGDTEDLGLSGALAAALADAEKLAQDKTMEAQREQVLDALSQVTGEGAQVGPDIRGMPAEQAAPRPDGVAPGRADGGGSAQPDPALRAQLRALGQQLDEARRQLEEEKAATARAERQLEQVRGDLKATRQRFLRLSEHQEEQQRRANRQEQEMPTRLKKQILRGLLPALDTLDAVTRNLLADKALPLATSQGVQMLRTTWDRALQGAQVVAFDASGQAFDPVVHEAISEETSDAVAPGTVLRQVGRGYLLEGRLLRSAQVIVARAADSEG